MGQGAQKKFREQLKAQGFESSTFAFVTPCAPIPDEAKGSDSRTGKFVDQYRDEFLKVAAKFKNKKLVIFLGPVAGRQVFGKGIKITKIRGQITKCDTFSCPIMAMLGPTHVLQRPELQDTFETDFLLVRMLADNKWKPNFFDKMKKDVSYEWCLDLQPLLDNPPRGLSADIESAGGRWYNLDSRILTVQVSYKKGHALVVPLDIGYWPELTEARRIKLIKQFRKLFGARHEKLGNKFIQVVGHNFNSDRLQLAKLQIHVADFRHDTMQLAFVVDENMINKGADDCVRRWVPAMAGYADEFNRDPIHNGKENMERVPHDKMLDYGGGDTDANLRLCKTLLKKAKADKRNYRTYQLIQMPAIRTFMGMEQRGMEINTDALDNLGVELAKEEKRLYKELISEVHPKVKRKHIDAGSKGKGTGLSFNRPEFVIDILFGKKSQGGFGLKPVQFTKGTRKLKDDALKVPSTSTKDHLPFFDDDPWVEGFIRYKKLEKMKSTYVGHRAGIPIPSRRPGAPPKFTEAKGFWQYIDHLSRIHPSTFLHRTNTGRTASSYPNCQNFPKRGDLAKAFRKIFRPTEGYAFVETDLSQAEIRIAAWMAREPTMLAIYNAAGGDIHSVTASIVLGISPEEFRSWKNSKKAIPEKFFHNVGDCRTLGDLYAYKRYQAKAVAFVWKDS